jgi:three-Cys-motif partner protein
MVTKRYSWKSGATLEDHSKRKLKILREYFARYLDVRCQRPQQTRFRLAIVEGFSGGGHYVCGTAGSPIIFIEELRAAAEQFNLKRASEGMALLDIECLLVLNDEDRDAIEVLKTNVEPLLAAAKADVPRLHLQIKYLNKPFEDAYLEIKGLLDGRYGNVLVNLDQYGHSQVERNTITDIVATFASAEIFYTFSISSLLAFLPKSDSESLTAQLKFLGVIPADISSLDGRLISNKAWLGAAERFVFASFQRCATYVSPFSINNPDGWRYWLIHFANNYRARQEYNNVLHQNSSAQAHFGRSGLHMLSFDPAHDSNALYLFDTSGRTEAKKQLSEDIPRLVAKFGDAVGVSEFYRSIYNMTPAHMDDVHAAIIENQELEVITERGGERRKANTIELGDTLRIKQQRSFFPIFLGDNPSRAKK